MLLPVEELGMEPNHLFSTHPLRCGPKACKGQGRGVTRVLDLAKDILIWSAWNFLRRGVTWRYAD